MNQTYIDTVRLLLAIAPAVFASGRFAMKGGTALNLFVQQMPRLSVDIDLVLVDHRLDRHAALQAIGQELAAVQAALAGQGYRAHLPANTDGDDVTRHRPRYCSGLLVTACDTLDRADCQSVMSPVHGFRRLACGLG